MLSAVTDYADVPAEIVEHLRAACRSLPEIVEEQAWAGTRWRIRKRTFAHVLCVDNPDGPVTMLTFRSEGDELDALVAVGHPFFKLGWSSNMLGMVLDRSTDWTEVTELVTDSYCLLAPKKLAATIPRPDPQE
jgi:hypothetical protein